MDNVITITSKDFPDDDYSYIINDDDADDNDETTIDFAYNSVKREYADRHPTSSNQCGFAVDRKDIDQKVFDTNIHSPINTIASKYLLYVAFAGGDVSNNGVVKMKSSYRHQISLRVEEESCSLNLDCFEYKPTCLDITKGGEAPPPTFGEICAYENLTLSSGRGSKDETNDIELYAPEESLPMFHYEALIGKFLNSRVFRLRIALSNVKGIRLMANPIDNSRPRDPRENDNDISAVLILETTEPLGEDSFAVRTVRSKRGNDDAFVQCPDWLPGDHTASKATRLYFYGSLNELRQTAGYIAKICPKLARMLEAKESNSLALAPGVVSVDYASAPSHNQTKMNGNNSNKNKKKTYSGPLPSPSAWDGKNDSVNEVFEKVLAREENPMKRMMLRIMCDPESALRVNQDPNSSPEDVMLSTLMCQQFMAGGGTDGMVDRLESRGVPDCVIS